MRRMVPVAPPYSASAVMSWGELPVQQSAPNHGSPGATGSASAGGSPWLHGLALVLLVVFPLALMICLTQTSAWPEVLPAGDDALTELAVWHTLHDVQFTGICSHHCFRNPGPMYFYLLAPLYGLSGFSRGSFPVSVGLINLASLLGVLWVTWRCAGRMMVLGAAVLLTFYIRFLGIGSLVSSWPADVQTLPFLLAVVLFAAVAAGHWNYLPAGVFVASLPAQTNVAYIPALTAVAVVSLAMGFVGWASPTRPTDQRQQRGRGGRHTACAAYILAALALLAIIWMLPLVRELTQPTSDVAQAIGYFAGHAADRKTWAQSLAVLADQFAAFPRFCLTGEGRSATVGGPSWIAALVAGVEAILLAATCVLARRMQRRFDAALALLSLVLLATFLVSIHHIVGPIVVHMVRWMTIVSLLAILAAGGTFAAAKVAGTLRVPSARTAEDGAPGEPAMQTSCPVPASSSTDAGGTPTPQKSHRRTALALAAILVLGAAMNVRDAVREPARRAAEEFDENTGIPQLAAAAQSILERDGANRCLVRIVDHDVWTTASELVVRLTKAGFHPAVDASWEIMFGPQHAPPEVPDDTLLLCLPETGRRWLGTATAELVGETPGAMLFRTGRESEFSHGR